MSEQHRCDVSGCDGTRLGHDLAVDFPEETARFDAAMTDLRAKFTPTPHPTDSDARALQDTQAEAGETGDRDG